MDTRVANFQLETGGYLVVNAIVPDIEENRYIFSIVIDTMSACTILGARDGTFPHLLYAMVTGNRYRVQSREKREKLTANDERWIRDRRCESFSCSLFCTIMYACSWPLAIVPSSLKPFCFKLRAREW